MRSLAPLMAHRLFSQIYVIFLKGATPEALAGTHLISFYRLFSQLRWITFYDLRMKKAHNQHELASDMNFASHVDHGSASANRWNGYLIVCPCFRSASKRGAVDSSGCNACHT